QPVRPQKADSPPQAGGDESVLQHELQFLKQASSPNADAIVVVPNLLCIAVRRHEGDGHGEENRQPPALSPSLFQASGWECSAVRFEKTKDRRSHKTIWSS